MMKVWIILSLLLASGLPATAAVIREPYLQMVTPTSVTIVWQTDIGSANNSRVQYGTVAGNLNQTAFGSAVIPPSNLSVKNHVVMITGLSSATTYFYNVGTVTNGVQGGGTPNHFFMTAPTVGTTTPFRAWILGDSGDGPGDGDQEAVRDAMLAETALNPPSPDIILHAGDIAYADGTDTQFTTNHFAIYQNILRHTPLWPTLGNHEARNSSSASGLGPYYEAHVLPTGGEAGGAPSGTEAYYSFDYANAHFIVLDSMDSNRAPGSPMLTWLQADLSGTAQEWVIVLFHHPPYTKGSHDSDSAADSGGRLTEMRENVLPILEAGGVDLVLGGHSHIYERSYPLLGAYGYGSSPDFVTPNKSTLVSKRNILDTGDGKPSGGGAYTTGTVYVVAGHGGRSVSSAFGGNHPVMFFSEAQFGSVLLDINGSNLTVQNVRSDQSISDTFTITKNSLANANIVWRNTGMGAVAAWHLNGLDLAGSNVLGTVSNDWAIVGLGDLDGNAKTDLVWRNTSTGAVSGWLMNGLTLTNSQVIATVGNLDWTIKGVGDLDGDGKADLVWRNTSTGAVTGWLMNGLTLSSFGVIATVATDWEIQ